MKTIILAGGLGSRISEETDIRPKPMVEIGGKPLLWHIMQIYLKYFNTEFIIATGYKADVIDEYIKKEKFNFWLFFLSFKLNKKTLNEQYFTDLKNFNNLTIFHKKFYNNNKINELKQKFSINIFNSIVYDLGPICCLNIQKKLNIRINSNKKKLT